MSRILWIEASPKAERSTSSACARAFLDAAQTVDTSLEVSRRNVWTDEIVPFSREGALAKFGPLFGEDHTPEQARIWSAVEAEIEHVRSHDHLLVSTPMWNWSVPYALKHWIDVITQPLLSFTIDADGRHIGALGDGGSVQLILTRSSAYDGRHPELQDFQRPYLEYLFTILGYGSVDTLVVEPTTFWTADERASMHTEALAAAAQAGLAFARTRSTTANASS